MESRACPYCSARLPDDPNLRFCPECGAALSEEMLSAAAAPAVEGDIPMEQIERYGFFPALWQTFRQVLLDPVPFFQRVGRSTNLGAALLFAVVIGAIGYTFSAVWGFVMEQFGMGMTPPQAGMETPQLGPLAIPIVAVLSPLIMLIVWGLGTLIAHLFLAITGGARKDINTTGRVMAYSMAPMALNVIPVVGMAAGIWVMVVEIIGLAQAHETDTWRAAVAVLLPSLLCCCAGVVLAMLMIAASGAAVGL